MRLISIWPTGRFARTAVMLVITAPMTMGEDFTVHMKSDSGDTSTYHISRNAIRKTFSATGTDATYRLDQGKVIFVNHKEKSYREIPLEQARLPKQFMIMRSLLLPTLSPSFNTYYRKALATLRYSGVSRL